MKIRLKYLYLDLGKECSQDYKILDDRFKDSIGTCLNGFDEDIELQSAINTINILAYHYNKPIGLINLYIQEDTSLIGKLFVNPEFRKKIVILDETSWLDNEKDYRTWQYLLKSVYILSKRAGYEKPGSFIHNLKGKYARDWRDSESSKWELEIGKTDEPSELLKLIRK